MRSTSEGSNLNPESSIFVPGVWREAQAPIGNAYVDRDLQGTNSHAHPENTQLSEPMASTSNLASGHGDQTSSAAGNTERVYVGYVVRKTPTSSAESSTRKRALPESPGGYELAEAQDSSSAAAAPALPNSEIDNSQTGKSKETTPPMSSAQDSDINEKSQKDNGKGRGKGKDKATETTRPMSHPGVEVREKSQEGRPSGSTATTFNLETIAEIDRDPIRTRKPSNVPGNETEDEDEGNSGSVHVGSAGEGVNNGDPSSSTRPTKKRRRKKKSSQPTQKIEEAANEETVNEETANEETSAKEEEAMKEQTKLCKSVFSCSPMPPSLKSNNWNRQSNGKH
jgi:hypothetical protein